MRQSNDERLYKCIALSLFSIVCGSLLLHCNYNIQYLPMHEIFLKLYQDIISHWQKINKTKPKTNADALNQIIQKNQFIRVNKSSVFFCLFVCFVLLLLLLFFSPGWKIVGLDKLLINPTIFSEPSFQVSKGFRSPPSISSSSPLILNELFLKLIRQCL